MTEHIRKKTESQILVYTFKIFHMITKYATFIKGGQTQNGRDRTRCQNTCKFRYKSEEKVERTGKTDKNTTIYEKSKII